MGLHSQIPTDSLPLLLITTIASSVIHLRSIFRTFLNTLRLNRIPNQIDHTSFPFISENFLLADQLNMNRICSHKYGESKCDVSGVDCVVCLCGLKKGDQVRRLPCCHVFHKSCFDGWLDHFNFNCPLCRASLINGGLMSLPLLNQSVDESIQ